MSGGRQRSMSSLYRASQDEGPSTRRRRRRRRELTPSEEEAVEEEEVPATPKDEAQADEGREELEQEDEPSAEADEGSAASGAPTPYLQGPASLPARLIPCHQRPVIRPIGQRHREFVEGRGRKPNDIFGLLCREHYPGIVQYAGKTESAYTFDHYTVTPDPNYPNKAARIKAEVWDFYTPTLAQLRAQSTSGSVPICPRPSPSQSRVADLETRLDREREERQQMEAQMRAQMEAQAKQMADLIAFMASKGMQVPPSLMTPPPPPQNAEATPPPSVGSNNPTAPGWNTPGGQGDTSPGWPGPGWS